MGIETRVYLNDNAELIGTITGVFASAVSGTVYMVAWDTGGSFFYTAEQITPVEFAAAA